MTEGPRQAALALHALGAGDRDWILGRLGGPERREIDALLGELRELGIPVDRAVVEQALPKAPPTREPSVRDRIRRATLERLLAALAPEPAMLVARVLTLEEWPWRDAFAASLPRLRRAAVVAAMRELGQQPRPAMLDEAMLRLLDERLQRAPRLSRRGRAALRMRRTASALRAWLLRRRRT